MYINTSHSTRSVGHYIVSYVSLFARPRPQLPVTMCSMRAGPSAPMPTSVASAPLCPVPSAQSVCSGDLPAGPATNRKRQFSGLYL